MFEAAVLALATVIALGPIWWLGLIILFAFMVLLSEHESPGIAIIAVLLVAGLFWLTGHGNLALWSWNNPGELLLKIAMWFGGGALYAGYRFDRHGYDESLRYLKEKASMPGNLMQTRVNPAYVDRQATPDVPTTVEVDTGTPLIDKASYIPTALNNKHKLTNWIVLWPFSAFWYVCSQGVKRVVDFIIRHCQGIYNRLAARHFEGLA